ncbi:MAG: PilT/PilU family type 4a pilus ATPase [Myxococcota bacterium]|nr:PilT/PilU family type 4a pilus ATPase [Myxococcota bacterium]
MRPIEGQSYTEDTKYALSTSALFHGLSDEQLADVAKHGSLFRYTVGQHLARQGEPSDAFDIFVKGAAVVQLDDSKSGSTVELARLSPPDSVGEMGVLLETPRSASVLAIDDEVIVIRFTKTQFSRMIQSLPFFGLVLSRTLAARLHAVNRQVSLPEHLFESDQLDEDLFRLLPADFISRHRVLPVSLDHHHVTIGFVDQPTDTLLQRIQRLLTGMVVRPVSLTAEQFDETAPKFGVRPQSTIMASQSMNTQTVFPLDSILRQVVAEGASDLHISANQVPRWRIDGALIPIPGHTGLTSSAIASAMNDIMPLSRQKEFAQTNDTDFAYQLGEQARFRVNVFRDIHGVSAVLRHIPSLIRTPAQLGLPEIISSFCKMPHGLILVTGPTGSGKSTTLAAMIDSINRERAEHIITLEDPVEFVHKSSQSMVNQREVGSHTDSFARALRAALREDPDVVLVGELRDLETISLAIETAQTGHLVFATLHTSTAIGTIDRIVGMFPPDQQGQTRLSLAEVLKGVVAQTLLPRRTGGRVAAFEILVSSPAVANLIREAKSAQLVSTMEVGRKAGNSLLNDELVRLVNSGLVEMDVAHRHAIHKDDFLKRLKRVK